WHQQQERERLARIARQERASDRAKAFIDQVAQTRKRMRWKEARVHLTQAREAVLEAEDEGLAQKFQQAGKDLSLAEELDRVREEAHALVESRWVPSGVKDRYPV